MKKKSVLECISSVVIAWIGKIVRGYLWLSVGLNWSKYLGNPADWILWKQANFLNHCLNVRDSRLALAHRIFPNDPQ